LKLQSFFVDNKELFYIDNHQERFTISSSPVDYEVTLEKRPFHEALRGYCNDGDVILIDKNVIELYPIQGFDTFVVEAIEENKTIDKVLEFVEFLNNTGFNKGNKVIVIGGGITQDIGAFACSVFKRGIDWVLFPTTLLSMCDSCIGGKTGINHLGAKNQLALFSSPWKVVVCFEFLDTLKDEDIKSGLGEILKLYAMAGHQFIEFFSDSLISPERDYYNLVRRALLIKKSVIEEDEFEFNIRKSLNYGHTIGHAVEALSNYKIPHGEAVAIGMVCVNRIFNSNSKKLDNLCIELIDKDVLRNIDCSEIGELLKKDKKTIGSKATFVVLEEFGKICFISRTIDDNLVDEMNEALRALCE